MVKKLEVKLISLLCIVSLGCASKQVSDDKYLWLEDIEGAKALTWVKAHNEKTVSEIKATNKISDLEKEIKEVILAKDRIPMPMLLGKYIYNFWQDEVHVKGIWRRTTIESYRQSEPKWEILLDVDALGKKDNKEWVFKGASCLKPLFNPCLVMLSNGGKDAYEVREFDTQKVEFVEKGFVLPEAKHRLAWRDENHLVIGSDFGKGSLTSSGYPRVLKLWTRGESLDKAPIIFEGQESDVQVYPWVTFEKGKNLVHISRSLTFFTSENFVLNKDLKLVALPIPKDAEIQAYQNGVFFYKLRTDFKYSEDLSFSEGSVLALRLNEEKFNSGELTSNIFSKPELVVKPEAGESVQNIIATKSDLYLLSLKNVQSEVYKLDYKQTWQRKKLNLPAAGTISVQSENELQDEFLINFENFLTPNSVLLGTRTKTRVQFKTLKSLPQRFNSENMAVDQFFATSKDGTKIPYFVFRPKDLLKNGQNPTLMYGYGGFEISETPFYPTSWGKSWVSRQGVFVLTNLRGGGEFGPKWHLDGIQEKKQNVFDDFIAIAEDLIARKITSPERLGIMGGSNGGLLVGATMVQRPELFKAVVCQVPLLDMLRYHKLLAGNSWVNEYGNPEDPKMREVILKYSPLQNVKKDAKYPEAFFITSTKDDRVHPGHARKMAAKMEDFGHKIYYYENTGGGHSADSNLNDRVFRKYLELAYLFEKLMD